MKILIEISDNHYNSLKKMREEYDIKLGAYNDAILNGKIVSDETVEKITYLDDEWDTECFKRGWREGYGMGKQDLAKTIIKTLERVETEGL